VDISKRVYQRLRKIGYGTVPDFFCCSAKHRQQINRRTNPCPTPSPLPPLSKVRCCRPQKNLATTGGIVTLTFASHPTLKNPHYPFALHYILASPRKRGGGLTALQNRYSASSSFCNLSDCFQNYYTFCRQDGGDCFPLAPSLRCYPLTFKRVRFCCSVKPSQLWWGLPHPHHQLDFPHHPSKTTNTLASLVKGRWIDGKAQAFILLLSACATSAFFIHQTFLPSRRRDC
jgi:hypothetical protein